MELKMFHKLAILSSVYFISTSAAAQQSFEDAITFYGYSETSKPFISTFNDNFTDFGCDPSGLWAIIIHGWLESTNHTTWIPDLIGNLSAFRGGCILTMDYFNYSKLGYYDMYYQFDGISNVLLMKVNQLYKEGFKPENGYMFGFSFGSHLVYDVGIKTGGQIARIDTCDPAGPGFDGNVNLWKDPKLAGKTVQCINTSLDKGTYTRSCHLNWLMGTCGYFQPAAESYPMGHHGLCPHFYNAAFTTNFVAERNPDKCTSYIGDVAWCYPSNFKMGYMESRMSQVNGTLFARTFNTLTYGPKQ